MAQSNVPLWTRDTPWRQGHVLPPETVSALKLHHPESHDDTCVVVVSHDCDIANDNLAAEDCVELIVGRRIDKINNAFALTRNPRVLHLEIQRSNAIIAVALDATKKQRVLKEELAKWLPDGNYHLIAENLVILKKWLGIRYNRAAFPNEFERRLTDLGLRDKIDKALKRANKSVSSVHIRLNTWKELPSSGSPPYELTIILLYQPGKNPDEAADLAEAAATQIETDLLACCYDEASGSWRHLEVKQCFELSEDDAVISRFNEFQQWRLDHWSYKPGVEAALPPSLDI